MANNTAPKQAMNLLYCICIKLQWDSQRGAFNAKIIRKGFGRQCFCPWTLVALAVTLCLFTSSLHSKVQDKTEADIKSEIKSNTTLQLTRKWVQENS